MGKLESGAALKAGSHPFEGKGHFLGRTPQMHSLPDTVIVSADNHICLGGEDFFYDNAPAALKDKVPRIIYDSEQGYWITAVNGRWLYPVGNEEEVRRLVKSVEGHDGAWNVDQRAADMDAEGVSMEIAFPQVLPGLFTLKDFELREYIMRQYNLYLARLQRRQPGRFYGVGIANFWDPASADGWFREMKDDGLKVVMLPLKPGTNADGSDVVYSSDALKPMWNAIQENDLTVAFHIGEVGGPSGKGGFAAGALGFLGSTDFRVTFGKLVFGGVLDDFPDLRIVFAEANLSWVAGMLQDADMVPEAYPSILDYKTQLRPSEYWKRNCFATFMYDPAGLKLIDDIGVETAMWSVDYPHNEGTFGYSGDAVQSIVDRVGEDKARLICGENARRCFRI